MNLTHSIRSSAPTTMRICFMNSLSHIIKWSKPTPVLWTGVEGMSYNSGWHMWRIKAGMHIPNSDMMSKILNAIGSIPPKKWFDQRKINPGVNSRATEWQRLITERFTIVSIPVWSPFAEGLPQKSLRIMRTTGSCGTFVPTCKLWNRRLLWTTDSSFTLSHDHLRLPWLRCESSYDKEKEHQIQVYQTKSRPKTAPPSTKDCKERHNWYLHRYSSIFPKRDTEPDWSHVHVPVREIELWNKHAATLKYPLRGRSASQNRSHGRSRSRRRLPVATKSRVASPDYSIPGSKKQKGLDEARQQYDRSRGWSLTLCFKDTPPGTKTPTPPMVRSVVDARKHHNCLRATASKTEAPPLAEATILDSIGNYI